jgi:hypothetical protein
MCDDVHLCNHCVREFLILKRTWFAFGLPSKSGVTLPDVAELPELFQLKCLSPALEARPHLNGNNPSIPRI